MIEAPNGLVYVNDSVFPNKKSAEDAGYDLLDIPMDNNISDFGGLENELIENPLEISEEIIEEAYALVRSKYMDKWGRHSAKDIKGVLSGLRNIGISVEPYSNLDSDEVKNYFSQIVSKISRLYEDSMISAD